MTTKKHQSTKLSQLDKAAATLKELKVDVTAEDRRDAATEHNLSKATVDRYLLGEVRKVDVALRLIQFFRNRIAKREKLLAA